MLLMEQKGIRRGIWHSISMQKVITNTRKTMIKIKNRDIFNIGIQIIDMNERCHKSCL